MHNWNIEHVYGDGSPGLLSASATCSWRCRGNLTACVEHRERPSMIYNHIIPNCFSPLKLIKTFTLSEPAMITPTNSYPVGNMLAYKNIKIIIRNEIIGTWFDVNTSIWNPIVEIRWLIDSVISTMGVWRGCWWVITSLVLCDCICKAWTQR